MFRRRLIYEILLYVSESYVYLQYVFKNVDCIILYYTMGGENIFVIEV